MIVIQARNPNQMMPEVMHQLKTNAAVVERGSRNGKVRVFSGPTTFQYNNPLERVVYWQERDANPFFHFFESLWMLAGRNDVAYVSKFSSQIGRYSDDGATFHGAYGYRWRKHFKFDQLQHIVDRLKANPEDRRCVLSMWDANVDGRGEGKDYPCNLVTTFQINAKGQLDMVVYNRSNDIVWGALGANCVHFSYLLEFVAAGVGVDVGQYWQVSSNMHGYLDLNPLLAKCLPLSDLAFPSKQSRMQDPYEMSVVKPFPLVTTDMETWHGDLRMFLASGPSLMGYRDSFFRRVAVPMALSYQMFTERENGLSRFHVAIKALDSMPENCDWKLACTEWLERRWYNASEKQQRAVEAQEKEDAQQG